VSANETKKENALVNTDAVRMTVTFTNRMTISFVTLGLNSPKLVAEPASMMGDEWNRLS